MCYGKYTGVTDHELTFVRILLTSVNSYRVFLNLVKEQTMWNSDFNRLGQVDVVWSTLNHGGN